MNASYFGDKNSESNDIIEEVLTADRRSISFDDKFRTQVTAYYVCLYSYSMFTLSRIWNRHLESQEKYPFFFSINWRNANYSDEIFYK